VAKENLRIISFFPSLAPLPTPPVWGGGAKDGKP